MILYVESNQQNKLTGEIEMGLDTWNRVTTIRGEGGTG